MNKKVRLLSGFVGAVIASSVLPSYADQVQDIHRRLLTMDTHVDIDVGNFTEKLNYTQNLATQVDLGKLESGGLDAVWLIVYTGQGELNETGYAKAWDNAIAKFDAIHRLTEEIAPERIGLALNSDDVRRLHAEGRKVALIGVENAYPLGTDISRAQEFYDRGARYMSLAHNGHSQFADSNTGEEDGKWLHGGLSDLGRELVGELNRLGIMIDLSHPSKAANLETLRLTRAPVIASHSSARALNDVSRNLSDEELMALKANGGVVQAVAFRSYLNSAKHSAWEKKSRAILRQEAEKSGFELKEWDQLRTWGGSARRAYLEKYRALQRQLAPRIEREVNPATPPVNVKDFADHIDYLVEKVGIRHVGISSDFDGGGGVYGWSDASETESVTRELFQRGYTGEQLSLLWGGNLLRVMDQVQMVAQSLQKY